MAETDWLTGLYNRGAMENKVNAVMKQKRSGAMAVFDLDGFKQVNDRYGHIVGDQLIRTIGEILGKMISKSALVGRVGGDEFAIFFPGSYTETEMERQTAQIQERFREIHLSEGLRVRLSLTIAWAYRAGCKDYRELFDLVDQKMLEKKRLLQLKFQEANLEDVELKSVSQDIRLIMKDLNEPVPGEGAYCQDYETFRRLFRLEMRRMKRKEASMYLILFTLMDKNNSFIAIQKRDVEMELLGDEIGGNLRLGDVYTRYSSCQYLVMVADVQGTDVDRIAERIRQSYYRHHGDETENLILHRCYPLKSVR